MSIAVAGNSLLVYWLKKYADETAMDISVPGSAEIGSVQRRDREDHHHAGEHEEDQQQLVVKQLNVGQVAVKHVRAIRMKTLSSQSITSCSRLPICVTPTIRTKTSTQNPLPFNAALTRAVAIRLEAFLRDTSFLFFCSSYPWATQFNELLPYSSSAAGRARRCCRHPAA